MSVDGTMGLRGPGNSGFFIIRSNCKTNIYEYNDIINWFNDWKI